VVVQNKGVSSVAVADNIEARFEEGMWIDGEKERPLRKRDLHFYFLKKRKKNPLVFQSFAKFPLDS
jgi:hypothetical protein